MSAEATIDESYDDFDDQGGLSGFWILLIFLVVLAAFAGIVYIAYQKGVQSQGADQGGLPLVSADPTPVRREVALDPAEGTRQEVLDELNAAPTAPRVIAEVSDDDPLKDFVEDEANGAAGATGPVAPSPTSTPAPSPTESTERTASAATATAPNVSVPSRKPEVAPTRPVTRAERPSTAAPRAAITGGFAVQVGAFASTADANGRFSALAAKHGGVIADQPHEVRVATVNGKTFHRLWIGAFADRSGADGYCKTLTQRGVGCYVQRR